MLALPVDMFMIHFPHHFTTFLRCTFPSSTSSALYNLSFTFLLRCTFSTSALPCAVHSYIEFGTRTLNINPTIFWFLVTCNTHAQRGMSGWRGDGFWRLLCSVSSESIWKPSFWAYFVKITKVIAFEICLKTFIFDCFSFYSNGFTDSRIQQFV